MSLLAKWRRKAISAGLVLLLFTTCQEPTPARPEPYPNSTLTLEAIQVNSIDAVLKLTLTNLDSLTGDTLPIILSRNGHAVQAFNFIPPDTTLWDEGLEPGRSYSYTAYRQSVHNTALIDSSAPVSLTTLDTTSHDFTWTIDTLGNYGSYLNDVAIIDENNIWVVGNIETDSGSYNAAHWDGEQWEMIRIAPAGFFGPVTAIFAYSETDIWFGKYGLAFHFNGQDFTRYDPGNSTFPGMPSINAIWGSSPEDVYFVGDHGSIVHYDGSGFIRLESGTDVDLTDIRGVNADSAWCAGWDLATGHSVIYEIKNQTVHLIYEFDGHGNNSIKGFDYHSPVAESVWPDLKANILWITGPNGLSRTPLGGIPNDYTDLTDNIKAVLGRFRSARRIRGNARNDIMASGWTDVIHWNGESWFRFEDLINDPNAIWSALAIQGNRAVVGGSTIVQDAPISLAIVARGYR